MPKSKFNYCVFDLETQKLFSELGPREGYAGLGVSVLGAYFSQEDLYIAFLEKDLEEFIERLKSVDLVVGYNSNNFDLPVLQAYTHIDLQSLPKYDILLEIEKQIGFKVKLDDVSKATLGVKKTDKGINAIKYFRNQDWHRLIDYCMWDVRITKEVFDQILSTGKISFSDFSSVREVQLDPIQLPTKNLRYFEKGIF